MTMKKPKTKEFLQRSLARYERMKEMLDDDPCVTIYDQFRQPFMMIDTGGTHSFIARTMEYIYGLKYDLDRKIVEVKEELKNFDI